MQNQFYNEINKKFHPPSLNKRGFSCGKPTKEPGIDFRPGEKLHKYHLKLNQKTFNELEAIIRKGLGIQATSVGDLVAKILKYFYSFLEVKHFSEPERMTAYAFIDTNHHEERCSVKVIIPKRLYNRIKLLHKDLDTFSMAQLVREVIHWFLSLLEEWEQGLKDFLGWFDFYWHKLKAQFRKNQRPIREVPPQTEGPPLLYTTYSDQFSPIEIFLC